jgi:hypothetical protein
VPPPPPWPAAAPSPAETADCEPVLEGERVPFDCPGSVPSDDDDADSPRDEPDEASPEPVPLLPPVEAACGGAVDSTTCASVLPSAPRWSSFFCSAGESELDDAPPELGGGFPPERGGAEPIAFGTTSRYWFTAGFPGGARYLGWSLDATATLVDSMSAASVASASNATRKRLWGHWDRGCTVPYTEGRCVG